MDHKPKEEDPQSTSPLQMKRSGSKSSTHNQTELFKTGFVSTAINNDLKAFERLKKKQEIELVGMVQYEIQQELMRKANEEKIRLQKEKEENHRYDIMMKHQMEEEKKRERELEMAERMEMEEKDKKRRDMEKYMEEQIRLKEEMENEKRRLKENKLKEEEDKRKKEEFQQKVERMLEENRRKIDEKEKFLAEKERERKELLEKKKNEQVMMSYEKAQLKKELIETNLRNLEKKLQETRENFLTKQAHNEEKRVRYEHLRQLAFKEQKAKSEQRAEEIKKVLETNEYILQQKVETYNLRQSQIQMRKAQLEEESKEEQKRKVELQRGKEEKRKQTLMNNEIIENTKKGNVISKIQAKEENTRSVQMYRELENMQRSEILTRKRLERKENIMKISRMQENERERTLSRILERNQRLEDFKIQRSIIADRKKQIQDEISRKKQTYIEKFDQIFKKKCIDNSSIKVLQEMFPENPEISLLIESLKSESPKKKKKPAKRCIERARSETSKISHDDKTETRNIPDNHPHEKTTKTSAQAKSQSGIENKNKNKFHEKVIHPRSFTEKEIMQKINDYRLSLNNELLKILSQERQKEDNRERALAFVKDFNERKRMEKLFGLKRAEASAMIVKKNEEIERKINEYENQIREGKEDDKDEEGGR